MLVTKNILKLNKLFVLIPKSMNRLNDMSENRWEYKILAKDLKK